MELILADFGKGLFVLVDLFKFVFRKKGVEGGRSYRDRVLGNLK